MSELDLIKERLTYLRLWLGVLVVTDLSLCGWLALNWGAATARLLVLAVIAVIALSAGLYVLDRRIERLIESLRDL